MVGGGGGGGGFSGGGGGGAGVDGAGGGGGSSFVSVADLYVPPSGRVNSVMSPTDLSPPAPAAPILVDTTPHSVTVAWSPPAHTTLGQEPTRYEVQMAVGRSGEDFTTVWTQMASRGAEWGAGSSVVGDDVSHAHTEKAHVHSHTHTHTHTHSFSDATKDSRYHTHAKTPSGPHHHGSTSISHTYTYSHTESELLSGHAYR